MANPEHLAILKQGVEAWNQWRKKNRTAQPDLRSADLRYTNLSSANLGEADLSNANLRSTDLSRTYLVRAYLCEADLSFAYLSDANLHSADLRSVRLHSADLSNANLHSANLRSASLHSADLSNANLYSANLHSANLRSASLHSADLSNANLHEANLSEAHLHKANLSEAHLHKANLMAANLHKANLMAANFITANLSKANLSKTNLIAADLRATNLSEASLIGANLSEANLSEANLNNADLSASHLSSANLRSANLSNANLSFANLKALQALAANFGHTILTGACIQDWNINSQTKLQEVRCDYVYLHYNYEEEEFGDRRPHDPNRIFAPGEFTERFQKVLDTVDLFFADGIDWKAFLTSLQDLQTQYGDDNLMVQGFERKGNGFEVRLAVSSNLDKAEIERTALEKYGAQLQLVEAKYRGKLHAREREIEIYKQQSADMLELAKLAASRPITVEAKAEAVADNQSKNTNYNLQNSKFGGGFAAEGGIQIGGQFIDASSQQNLIEAAKDIQALLNQLSTAYPASNSAQQMAVATKAVEEIEKNPALKQRVIAALKLGGTEAFKELVDHPAVNILLAAIEGWQNPD